MKKFSEKCGIALLFTSLQISSMSALIRDNFLLYFLTCFCIQSIATCCSDGSVRKYSLIRKIIVYIIFGYPTKTWQVVVAIWKFEVIEINFSCFII